jgi:hypothetical protein
MDLLALFQWCEDTALGALVRDSVWLFPAIEALHLVAFGVIGGAILLVDLRLCGLGLHQQPVARVAASAQPWLVGSLLVMIASGTAMFLSEAVKCYYSEPFRVKMIGLALAILFTFTVRRRIVAADEARIAARGKLVAIVSLGLWSSVAWGGRWIGFSG